jgi:hypothetical protein
MGATYEECLDELIAVAANAGYLGNEAVSANARAYGKRDPRLTRQARKAAKEAQMAEQLLNSTRARFLTNWSYF